MYKTFRNKIILLFFSNGCRKFIRPTNKRDSFENRRKLNYNTHTHINAHMNK